MIGWQHTAAFWALPLLAVPIIVHLLRVHRAERVLFPSLRFVQPSRTAAVRLRLPSDLVLLALRLSIVAAAIAALAGPILVTQSRLNVWNTRTARAVLVDTSASMNVPAGAGSTLATQAKDAGRAEAATATYGRVFEVPDVVSGLDRASTWLTTAPPARREIVVLSDFQRGALTGDTVARLPPGIGLRLVPIGQPLPRVAVSGLETLGASGVAQRHQNIEVSTGSTAVTFDASALAPTGGVRFVNVTPAEETALLRALAHAGTPAGSADQPIAFVFGADKPPSGLSPVRDRWMLRTLLRLQEDGEGVRPGSDPTVGSAAGVRPGSDPSRQELVVAVAAPANSFAAASAVRAVLAARRSVDDFSEQEIARTSEATLSTWNREAAPVDRQAWRTAPSTDARWCWLIALGLLAIEHWLRARPATRRSDEVTRVAA